MSATAIVGRKSEMADADDRAKAMVVPFRGLFYAGAIWVNPDDEDSQPLVCMMGPFGSEREAERNKKKIERWVAPCDLDEDTLSDSLLHRCGLVLHQSVLALSEVA